MRHTQSTYLLRPRGKGLRNLTLLCAGVLLSACGGTVRFADRDAISVIGPPLERPPVAEPPRVELRDDRIVINEKIQFAYNDDRILAQSFSLLDEIASVIKQNPQVKRIEIGGHASTEGSDEHNLSLSDRRAQAVMKHLVETSGVEAARLMAKGYGELKPLIHPDDSEEQREVNRRVEFLILEQEPRATETAQATQPEATESPAEPPPLERNEP